MKSVADCRTRWNKYPGNLDKMLKYIKDMDLVPAQELQIYLDMGPFNFSAAEGTVSTDDMTFKTIANKPDMVTGAGNLYRMGSHWAHAWFVSEQQWPRTDDLTIVVKSYDHFCPIMITDQINCSWSHKDTDKKGITFGSWGNNHSWIRNKIYSD